MKYASQVYFADLQRDMESLKLKWEDRPITDVYGLVSCLECTTNISSRTTVDKEYGVATNIGRLIESWLPVTFNPRVNGIGMCPEAEPKFVRGLDKAPRDGARSPLIIIDDDMPVAVAKADGEPTIYSFAEDKPHGLLPDTICVHSELARPVKRLPRRAGAYLIELSQLGQAFEPLRISILAVPSRHRQELEDNDEYWSLYNLDMGIENSELQQTCLELMCDSDAQMMKLNEYGALKPDAFEPDRTVLI